MSMGGDVNQQNQSSHSRTRGRSKQRENISLEAAGEIETALREIGLDLSEGQLQAMMKTGFMQDLLGGQAAQAFSPEALAEVEARAQSAGQLTGQEDRFITDAAKLGFAQGSADIDQSTQLGLQQLREELAPGRGLRSSDTPILDRGGQVVGQGIHQKGQLSLGLQGQAAQARLAFPLQRQAFQEQLRNQAFQNRLGMAGQASQVGLGLAGLFDPSSFMNQFLQERIAGKDKITRKSGVSDTQGTGVGSGSSFGGGADFGGM